MQLRFLQFLNEQKKITEKESLVQLRDNFAKVFPYSDYKNLKILNSTSKGKDTLTLTCRGNVEASEGGGQYTVLVQFHKQNLDDPWDLNAIVEVRCSCNAFRYNVAYPLFRSKNYAGRPAPSARIPNQVNNKEQIPTFCKHIYAYLRYLMQQNVIARPNAQQKKQEPAQQQQEQPEQQDQNQQEQPETQQ